MDSKEQERIRLEEEAHHEAVMERVEQEMEWSKLCATWKPPVPVKGKPGRRKRYVLIGTRLTKADLGELKRRASVAGAPTVNEQIRAAVGTYLRSGPSPTE